MFVTGVWWSRRHEPSVSAGSSLFRSSTGCRRQWLEKLMRANTAVLCNWKRRHTHAHAEMRNVRVCVCFMCTLLLLEHTCTPAQLGCLRLWEGVKLFTGRPGSLWKMIPSHQNLWRTFGLQPQHREVYASRRISCVQLWYPIVVVPFAVPKAMREKQKKEIKGLYVMLPVMGGRKRWS